MNKIQSIFDNKNNTFSSHLGMTVWPRQPEESQVPSRSYSGYVIIVSHPLYVSCLWYHNPFFRLCHKKRLNQKQTTLPQTKNMILQLQDTCICYNNAKSHCCKSNYCYSRHKAVPLRRPFHNDFFDRGHSCLHTSLVYHF